MGTNVIPEMQMARLSEYVAEKLGLHYPSERWPDLTRGLGGAAKEFGFDEVVPFSSWLLTHPLSPAQIHMLAAHLTVGETYFFRERKTFDVLAENVLPPLIHARRKTEPRLRLWSAGCCTGEEPYSLAILLHRLIPDLSNWHITILATDINTRFLQKAVAGVYGEWSFRDAPPWLKDGYFHQSPEGRYSIRAEIKKLVTFSALNLVEDVYPSLANDTNAMDVVFCRNVLMYFSPEQASKAVGNLWRAVVDDGWFVPGPTEGIHTLFSRFAARNFGGSALYQKCERGKPAEPEPVVPHPVPDAFHFEDAPASVTPDFAPSEIAEPALSPMDTATGLYQAGRYDEVADILLPALDRTEIRGPQAFSLLSRALANQGKLKEALGWCDRWIALDKLDACGHYVRATVLQELGDWDEARCSLMRSIYLDPDFVLAHFALGNLARERANPAEARRHFKTTLLLLKGIAADEVLAESDGLPAGRLAEIVAALTELEAIA